MSRRERRAAASKSASPPRGRARTPSEFYDAATRHMQSGQFVEAEGCCREALALDAGHADSLHLMGIVALANQDNERAIEWLVRAIRQTPQAEYLVNLGTALHRLGRWDEALKAYDKALLFKPDDAGIWTKMGHTLARAERYEEAALSFQHALKLDPSLLEAADGGSHVLFKLDRYDEALACVDIANELRPGDPELVQRRAACLVQLNRLDEGLVETNRTLDRKSVV